MIGHDMVNDELPPPTTLPHLPRVPHFPSMPHNCRTRRTTNACCCRDMRNRAFTAHGAATYKHSQLAPSLFLCDQRKTKNKLRANRRRGLPGRRWRTTLQPLHTNHHCLHLHCPLMVQFHRAPVHLQHWAAWDMLGRDQCYSLLAEGNRH